RHTRFSRDWSSDVCSSDLEVGDRLVQHARHDSRAREVHGDLSTGLESEEPRFSLALSLGLGLEVCLLELRHPQVVLWVREELLQIGRASCRERGEMSVGAE